MTFQLWTHLFKTNENDSKLYLKDLGALDEYRPKIEKLILKNQDWFANKDSELGHTDIVKMQMDTGKNKPIKMKPYRIQIKNRGWGGGGGWGAKEGRGVIEKAIDDDMLATIIIRRSRSPWSFHVVIVDKKDGSKRFYVDFRKLNHISKKNSYSLPMIDYKY